MANLQRCKKIGILGGTGWPSTVHYYAELCRRSEAFDLAADASRIPTTPEMCIESLDPSFAGAHGFLALALLRSDRPQEALAAAEKETEEPLKLWALSLVYQAQGRRKESDETLHELDPNGAYAGGI